MVTDTGYARRWIELRLGAEAVFMEGFDSLVDAACRELVLLAYRYGVDGRAFSWGMSPALRVEADAVIERLVEAISDAIYSAAVMCGDDDERRGVVTWLDSFAREDEPVSDKVGRYAGMLGSEVESLVACSMLLGMGASAASTAVVSARRSPWHSSLWKRGLIAKGVLDVSASILSAGGVSYGAGRSNVSSNALGTYGRGMVSAAWMHYWREVTAAGADYFRSITLDGTACSDCREEEQRGWQEIELYPEGGWHVNCRCAFIFANSEDI